MKTDEYFRFGKKELEEIKQQDITRSKTHSRPEPLGKAPTSQDLSPTNHSLIFTPEQEEARQAAKAGKLGIKFDNGPEKLRWDLLPYREVEEIVDVLTHGAEKYADNNWQFVPNRRMRYFAAAMRHLTKWFMGQRLDKDSGRNHLAHALCCILFLLWDDNENNENNK